MLMCIIADITGGVNATFSQVLVDIYSTLAEAKTQGADKCMGFWSNGTGCLDDWYTALNALCNGSMALSSGNGSGSKM